MHVASGSAWKSPGKRFAVTAGMGGNFVARHYTDHGVTVGNAVLSDSVEVPNLRLKCLPIPEFELVGYRSRSAALNLSETLKLPLTHDQRKMVWINLVESASNSLPALNREARITSEAAKQIEKDLPRMGFGKVTEDNQDLIDCFRSILMNVAASRGENGYQQGMHTMAYALYLIGLRGEHIYYGLLYLINKIGIGYFEHGFPGNECDEKQVIDAVKEEEQATGGSITRSDAELYLLHSKLYAVTTDLLSAVIKENPELISLWDVIALHKRPGWLALFKYLAMNTCRTQSVSESRLPPTAGKRSAGISSDSLDGIKHEPSEFERIYGLSDPSTEDQTSKEAISTKQCLEKIFTPAAATTSKPFNKLDMEDIFRVTMADSITDGCSE